MYNLCFSVRKGLEDYSPKIFQKIKSEHDKDAKGIFIAMDAGEAAYVEKTYGGQDIIICQLAEFMNEHWDEFTLDALMAYEKKYDAAPIWKYIYTDRVLIHRDYDYCVHTAAGLFAFWEHVFTTYNVDFYFDETVATLLTYTAYLVGAKTGTGCFTLFFMRSVGMDLTHHYIVNEPFEMMYNLPDDYATREYPKELMEKAEKFLTEYETKHEKPAFMKFSGRKPKLKASYLALPFFYLRQRFFNPYTRDKGSYIFYRAWEDTLQPIKFYFRYLRCKKYFHKADMTKNFVYYPLHLQPEATTIVCAQKYEKQLYFIDNIAKSLPADTVLYVKEHYSFLGSREESFYKALQEYPNVVVIDPWEDSFELIKNSQCVITLTGTAGMESMLIRHPVIMCGHIIYETAPGVMQVDEIFDNYFQTLESWKQPSREEVIKYLAAYMACARPGNTYIMSGDRLKDDNISLLAKSMMDYFNEMKGNTNE
ncbi:MAG: hypothetical protein K5773_08030 [Pseudobutyrivibrio sp.]|nr:hypothetical protein [Pseudobutyrivibrio sp.]